MKLDDKFSVVKEDQYNWVLRCREVKDPNNISKKTGKPVVTKNDWYFPTLKLLLKKYLDTYLGESKDAKEIYKRIEEVEANIDKLVQAGSS